MYSGGRRSSEIPAHVKLVWVMTATHCGNIVDIIDKKRKSLPREKANPAPPTSRSELDAMPFYLSKTRWRVQSSIARTFFSHPNLSIGKYFCHLDELNSDVSINTLLQIVSDNDLADLKMTREKVTVLEVKIKEQKAQIERINTALDVLLERRDKEKADVHKMISSEIQKKVLPFLERMTTEPLSSASQTYLTIIKDNLKRILSSNTVYRPLSSRDLTPTETHIIELIKQGKQSKEISNFLNISTSTVSFHRNNIRIKLGLKNSKKNLFAYLNSLKN
jgi:DNA-binding CsgD family transcriptional regulator